MRVTPIIIMLMSAVLSEQVFVESGRFGETKDGEPLLNQPWAIDHSALDIIYVADTGNNIIRLFDRKGKYMESIGGFGFNDDQFDMPADIWARSIVNIYVSDYNNQRLQRYDRQMNFISSLVNNDALEPRFQFAELASCAVSAQNDLFVLDHQDFKVIKFNRDGSAEHSFGQTESDSGELINPQQLDIWQGDKLLVSDADLPGLFVFDFFGNFIRVISDKRFKHPHGLGVAGDMVFLADPVARSVFIVYPASGEVKRIKNGIPFSRPMDVTVFSDKQGKTLFILDDNKVITGRWKFREQKFIFQFCIVVNCAAVSCCAKHPFQSLAGG